MRCDVSQSLGSDVFVQMKYRGYLDPKTQYKQGLLMNDEGKQLQIKKVFPENSDENVDVYLQYAHVVAVNDQLKCDPAVILGFDLKQQRVYPVLYRNDLLDHSIHVYENGELNEDNAEWLMSYWCDWFKELEADDYDFLDEAQLMTG